jgi:sulfonate transport system permease protein
MTHVSLQTSRPINRATPYLPASSRHSVKEAPSFSTPRRLSLGKGLSYGWVFGPLLLLTVWSLGSALEWIDPRILPAPWVAVTTGARLAAEGRLLPNILVSAGRVGTGLVFGILAGLGLALFSGLTRAGGYLIDGLVQIKRAVPIYALIPFFTLWFGIGEGMKVAVIAVATFYPVYLQTHNALRTIDLRYVELAESLRLSYRDFLRHIVLPGVLPGFLMGLRFSVMTAWLSVIIVEQTNATKGIGYMVTLAISYAQTDVMLVGLVLYAALGVASDTLIRLLQRGLLSWQRTLAG